MCQRQIISTKDSLYSVCQKRCGDITQKPDSLPLAKHLNLSVLTSPPPAKIGLTLAIEQCESASSCVLSVYLNNPMFTFVFRWR